MIFIDRKYLAVVETERKEEFLLKKDLRQVFIERPSNVCYVETDGKLYGIVSFGDILNSEGDMVRINTGFVSLSREDVMKARKRFRASDTICEIPVVKEGRLLGEFHKFDDELILERTRGFEYNAYAKMYFEKLERVALVKHPEVRDYKNKFFKRMKETLDRYKVNYDVIDFEQMVTEPEKYEMFLVVDEQERRGAELLMGLYEHKSYYFYRVVSYYGLITRLESSEVMDYGETLNEFKKKGVDVILLTANHSDRSYVQKIDAEMKQRFPRINNDLNELMKNYEEDFFDELSGDREYMDNIETGYFVVEKDREAMRLRDVKSPYINVKNGERRTVGQPEDYTRTIFFYGPCLIIGSYVGDQYTIESCLQRMINEAGYKVRVVNLGCWGGNVSCVSRMISTLISEGDMIVALLEDLDISEEGFRRIDLWETIEKHQIPSKWMLDMPYHVNHHVCDIYAKEIFDEIFDEDYRDKEASEEFISQELDVIDKFFTKKYFYGVDLDRYDSVACIITNGNPFTNGHRYLLETASKDMDHVYLLCVQEDASIFSYPERYAMAYEAVKDLENVTLIPSGLFVGNVTGFPAYYARIYTKDTRAQARSHVEAYASIARLLKATHRYIGEEPMDKITNEINIACREILPKYGIETVILKRKEEDGTMITGTLVRTLAENNDGEIAKYVPKGTKDIIFLESINTF